MGCLAKRTVSKDLGDEGDQEKWMENWAGKEQIRKFSDLFKEATSFFIRRRANYSHLMDIVHMDDIIFKKITFLSTNAPLSDLRIHLAHFHAKISSVIQIFKS